MSISQSKKQVALTILILVDAEAYSTRDPHYLGLTLKTSNSMEYHVTHALRRNHSVHILPFMNDIGPIIQKLSEYKPHLVFNMVQYFKNNRKGEILVPAVLDLMGIKYTGPSSDGIMLTNDKKLCKDILRQNGLRTPECFEIFPGEKVKDKKFSFPAIVKPNFGGASDCIDSTNIVQSVATLKKAARRIFDAGYSSAVVESFIPGKEVIIALVGNGKDLQVYAPREVVFAGSDGNANAILTETIKSRKKLRQRQNIYSQPLKVSSGKLLHIKQFAARAFNILKLSDYARIDMRMDLNGEVYIIDVNCNCNLRPGSKSFLRQFGNESFTKTIDKIVYHAMHKPPFC